MNENSHSVARQFALKFLYSCEISKVFYFSQGQFENFRKYFELPLNSHSKALELSKGTLDKIQEIDSKLSEISPKWSVDRMSSIDRAILRIACFEILEKKTPPRVVINEAIELAKKYGMENSSDVNCQKAMTNPIQNIYINKL